MGSMWLSIKEDWNFANLLTPYWNLYMNTIGELSRRKFKVRLCGLF